MCFAVMHIQEINIRSYLGILYLKPSNCFLYTQNKIQIYILAYKLLHDET